MRLAAVGSLLLVMLAMLAWWVVATTPVAAPRLLAASDAAGPVIRIGIIPERDIFEQRRRYSALADELSTRIGRPVELVTARSYQDMLHDLESGEVDAAFLGSFLAVLAMDRLDARPLVRPVLSCGQSTYEGVIFVRDDSSLWSVDDLGGHSLAMVRMTTGGHLFPICELSSAGLLDNQAIAVRWVGTHDEAVQAVVDGAADAGAAKSHRIDAYEQAHPQVRLRRLCSSSAVPENALLLRADAPADLGAVLAEALLAMNHDPAGRGALEQFGAERFVPCAPGDYGGVYELIDRVTPVWTRMDIDGPPPQAPSTRPAT